MASGISSNHSTVFGGLGTASLTVVTPGLYTCAFVSTIPFQQGAPYNSATTTGASGLQVVINLNGSPVLTVSGPSPTQPQMGGSVRIGCVATDVITVVTSSSAAADQPPNAVKTTINLYLGE